ncbi:class II fructose-bisphosphate aldolase [Mycetocola spongiae]|uniref:class II fructose-bisphosphate aldolase n=1 Tax=Mycetocola spongiae TaxID=2859226 RepID=UPI001CF3344E|nr:class II fructose-bisphosphate aldolase [Mycetocola spongiae]UCR89985.1 class II fructose-bisphosphate aldolase [Mycetocola spongiae]
MHARLDTLARELLGRGGAIAALTAYDYSTAAGIVAAAEDLGAPVTVLVTQNTVAERHGPGYVRALRALADAASVPVSVQLDHATDRALILAAVEAGVDSVLADGSRLPVAQNAAFVREIVEATAAAGIVVEAELGALAGDEDSAIAVSASGKTDASLVRDFVAESGCHLLAVAVGNVHGAYLGTPELDWDLIAAIRAQTDVPLTLHGASGLPESDIDRAPTAGLGKINVNTELRAAGLDALAAQLPLSRDRGDNVFDLERAWRTAATEFSRGAITRIGGAARA